MSWLCLQMPWLRIVEAAMCSQAYISRVGCHGLTGCHAQDSSRECCLLSCQLNAEGTDPRTVH